MQAEVNMFLGNSTFYHAILEATRQSNLDRTTFEDPGEVHRIDGYGDMFVPLLNHD
jgi:hypothetical protein